MPSSPVKYDNSMIPRLNLLGNFVEMLLHAIHADCWHYQPNSPIFHRTNSSKNIGILKLLLPNYSRATSSSRPKACDRSSLPHSCLILEPDLNIFWSNPFR